MAITPRELSNTHPQVPDIPDFPAMEVLENYKKVQY
jgi:hypothetical protein